MKSKTIFSTLLMAIFVSLSAQAQHSTFLAGHIYSEDTASGAQTMIPFATIKFYDIKNPTKVVAVRVSALNGSYDLKGFDTDETYIVKVVAPGISEQCFVTRPNKGRVKSGNLSAHACLKTEKSYESPVQKQSYSVSDLTQDKKVTVSGIIAKLPGLSVENNEIMTEEGGSVRLMINGLNPTPDIYEKIKNFPASEIVKSIDYYNLSNIADTAYDGVINICLVVGDQASTPNYKLISLKEYKE